MPLDRTQKEQLLNKVSRLVEEKYFDPAFDAPKWRALVAAKGPQILDGSSPEDFERQMHDLVMLLGSSHTAFYHRDWRPLPTRQSICVTLQQCETQDGLRWMLQDVQEGGPGHVAGLQKGDLLLAVGGQETRPPDRVLLRPGAEVDLVVQKPDGRRASLRFEVPPLKSKRPFSTPQAVVSSKLEANIGYVKINMFPGLVGIDVARDINRAMASLSDCDRLIVDLRGNSGGGIGCLRLMSYLAPGKLPIGYSLSRARARRGYVKEQLTRFDHIPSRKINLLWLALRYGPVDHSIALFTEGLGPKSFHGRIVLLVNEHSASASEMVAAFAAENHLARIVGTTTPGRLVGSKPFKLSHGYFLILPVGAYITWQGQRLEGRGVKPDVEVTLQYAAVSCGRDNQLDTAIAEAVGL